MIRRREMVRMRRWLGYNLGGALCLHAWVGGFYGRRGRGGGGGEL